MKTFLHLWQYLAELLEWEMFQMKVLGNIKTHILCCIFPESRAVYDIMSNNVVEPERPQMTISRVRVECWIRKATRAQAHPRTLTRGHPQSYVTHIAFPGQQWFSERASLLRYTDIASFFFIYFPLRASLLISNNIPTVTALIPIYIHLFGFTLPDAFRCLLCTPSSGASTRFHFLFNTMRVLVFQVV
jgi:hypothetical protein